MHVVLESHTRWGTSYALPENIDADYNTNFNIINNINKLQKKYTSLVGLISQKTITCKHPVLDGDSAFHRILEELYFT